MKLNKIIKVIALTLATSCTSYCMEDMVKNIVINPKETNESITISIGDILKNQLCFVLVKKSPDHKKNTIAHIMYHDLKLLININYDQLDIRFQLISNSSSHNETITIKGTKELIKGIVNNEHLFTDKFPDKLQIHFPEHNIISIHTDCKNGIYYILDIRETKHPEDSPPITHYYYMKDPKDLNKKTNLEKEIQLSEDILSLGLDLSFVKDLAANILQPIRTISITDLFKNTQCFDHDTQYSFNGKDMLGHEKNTIEGTNISDDLRLLVDINDNGQSNIGFQFIPKSSNSSNSSSHNKINTHYFFNGKYMLGHEKNTIEGIIGYDLRLLIYINPDQSNIGFQLTSNSSSHHKILIIKANESLIKEINNNKNLLIEKCPYAVKIRFLTGEFLIGKDYNNINTISIYTDCKKEKFYIFDINDLPYTPEGSIESITLNPNSGIIQYRTREISIDKLINN
jgi:hypothetical protein